MTTSFKESKKFTKGFAFDSGINKRQIPTNNAKNIICNIFASVNDLKMFEGKISTNGCNGPASLVVCALAILSFTPSELSYFSFIRSMVCSDIPFPGFTIFTIPKPMVIAITVVKT